MELPQELVRRLRSLRGAELGRDTTPPEIDLAVRQLGMVSPRSYGTFLELFGRSSIGRLGLYASAQS